MGQRWQRKFSEPIPVRSRLSLITLSDARALMLSLEASCQYRNEWQFAAGKIMEAVAGGDIGAAREAVHNALFLNMMLHFSKIGDKSRRKRDHGWLAGYIKPA